MSLLQWLMPWRRAMRSDKPFLPVGEVHETVRQSQALQQKARDTVKTSIDAIGRQQASGLLDRLIRRADEIRALTNETIDRTQ